MSAILAIRITLTIPDNEARTAYSTLRRLGVAVGQLERADLYLYSGELEADAVTTAVKHNEAMFNENMHELSIRQSAAPVHGELWVLEDRPAYFSLGAFGRVARLRAWRLLSMAGAPADEATVAEAAEVLLCNPAVQRRVCHIDELPLEDTIAR
jgi:phosphoribosylformylglycinamidine (FGAM) synthase PurS component